MEEGKKRKEEKTEKRRKHTPPHANPGVIVFGVGVPLSDRDLVLRLWRHVSKQRLW